MKQFVYFLLVLLFCELLSLFSVFALEHNIYELKELNMSIGIPADYVVFTRNKKCDNFVLSRYGLTYENLHSMMKENNIYLAGWDKDKNYELVITMVEELWLKDHKKLNETFCMKIIPKLETVYAGIGINIIKSSIYKQKKVNFIKLHIAYKHDNKPAYGVQYITIYNGKMINITLQTFSKTIKFTEESILQKIVDTIDFGLNNVERKSKKYIDKDTGVSFFIPESWVETPMLKKREFLDVKFTSKEKEGHIFFSGKNLFETKWFKELSKFQQNLLLENKDVLSNECFCKQDIPEMFKCKEKDISKVVYGGKEYFLIKHIRFQHVDESVISLYETDLVRFENGCMFTFCYASPLDNDEGLDDFFQLVSSVEYPNTVSMNNNLQVDKKKQDVTYCDEEVVERHEDYLVFIMILVLFGVVIIMVVQYCSSEGDSESTSNNKHGELNDVRNPITGNVQVQKTNVIDKNLSTRYCHKCGERIKADGIFCHKCGTKLFIKK